ncbi:White collar 1 protein [Penicillium taxi]|uniref:White collar 1 protein n=1 Tax=Penicillium taxi TaxID=168475 RepID=UPI002544E897|nr:White collar 1 protein [Penicillium taxi]KAJ5885286.1 White collar 1 protein [Penicillium taxi]
MSSYTFDYEDESEDMQLPLPNDPSLISYNNVDYSFSMLPHDGQMAIPYDRPPNVMLAYDPANQGVGVGVVTMPMNADPTNAFAYHMPPNYLPTPMASMNQQLQAYSPFPQQQQQQNPHYLHPQQKQQQQQQQPQPQQQQPQQQQQQHQPPPQQHPPQQQHQPPPQPQHQPPPPPPPPQQQQQHVPQFTEYNTSSNSTSSFGDSDFSRTSDPSQTRAPRQTQERRRQDNQHTSSRAALPVAIQPKRAVAVKSQSPGLSSPEAGTTDHTGIYSSSGLDVLGVLSRVAMRPHPKINIGSVDLSCAFVLCDILQQDQPIIYVSEAFERLTGYNKTEIVGRNCRFLQSPSGAVQSGAKRVFVDGQTVYRLRSTIDDRSEIQTSIINYRKGGQPFINLITMIPIQWDSNEYRYYVGFQVDLVEKPDAVTGRNPDGTYSINYQRDQQLIYMVPPPDLYRARPTQFSHDEVTAILSAAAVPGAPISRQYMDRILVENSDDLIHVLSNSGEFLYLSQACKHILEYDPIELVGKPLSTICHPSDIGPVMRDLRATTTSAPISIIHRIRQKYKGYIWFESHGSWHIDPSEGRKWLVMTGRPRPVYSLNQIAKLGSSAALAENDIWAKISLSGIILFVTSVKKVLGRSTDDLVGKGLHELMEMESDGNIISQALEAAALGLDMYTRAKSSDPPSFRHQMRDKKGNLLSAQTTIHAGDLTECRPSFLVAQIRFASTFTPSATAVAAAADEIIGQVPGSSRTATVVLEDSRPPRRQGTLGQRRSNVPSLGSNALPPGNRCISPYDAPATLFNELIPTRGSSWQAELRELQKQNMALNDDLARLQARSKKRNKRKPNVKISCAICHTKNTPEWRRGPSGERNMCNKCGLKYAKERRSREAQANLSLNQRG